GELREWACLTEVGRESRVCADLRRVYGCIYRSVLDHDARDSLMPSSVALCLTIGLVIYLFRRDAQYAPASSPALWIPLIWLLLATSRPLSLWLGTGMPTNIEDGSPLERTVFTLLQLVALIVLLRRGVSWSTVISRNRWLFLFIAYCGIAIL